jgi:hypothetical protein
MASPLKANSCRTGRLGRATAAAGAGDFVGEVDLHAGGDCHEEHDGDFVAQAMDAIRDRKASGEEGALGAALSAIGARVGCRDLEPVT